MIFPILHDIPSFSANFCLRNGWGGVFYSTIHSSKLVYSNEIKHCYQGPETPLLFVIVFNPFFLHLQDLTLLSLLLSSSLPSRLSYTLLPHPVLFIHLSHASTPCIISLNHFTCLSPYFLLRYIVCSAVLSPTYIYLPIHTIVPFSTFPLHQSPNPVTLYTCPPSR